MNKNILRREKRLFRESLKKREVEERSAAVKKELFSLPEIIHAKVILFYHSFDNEVSTDDMIKDLLRSGKKIALPVCLNDEGTLCPMLIRDIEKDLVVGHYGIAEPLNIRSETVEEAVIDCIVVPGIAFDHNGARIGMGKGYYDRFLKKMRDDQKKIALAYDEQVVEFIDTEDHDVQVDIVVTDKQIIRVEKSSL